jgi:membrane associated rhomboid family serine protease
MNDKIQSALDAASASAASLPIAAKVSGAVGATGGVVSVAGYNLGSDIAAWVGAGAAVAGMLIGSLLTWYYKHQESKRALHFKRQEDARAAELHEIEMKLKRQKLADCLESGDCG